ncbi:hypothetical protein NNJEOMEG_03616 [Fundidesulfovibrio magnetotacticus]|uniref:Glycosyltransferase n=1 Tax=Fundidesulfovibrio magnetotacticus TaxID=2730080 RepID=A0A6V8LZW0_9BACT|nr:glycosyltransferase family 2 protein [Fundidesulfovibrio magnetotacticus]GFK95748.1 hypothetical protein NNJEOMEG_03616 [Fundidesulfovibrio magnetotacticus]
MKTLFVLSALAEALLLLALWNAGRRHVLAGLRNPYKGPEPFEPSPRVAMIVPVTGDTPAVRAGLKSLLEQDYPNLRYFLVTRDGSDPAVGVIDALIAGRGDAVRLVSGPAETSGQKNHNLLAGVAQARHWADIYVFCDSTHVARPDLARLLARPIAEGKGVMSGGFHRVVPHNDTTPTLGMLLACMFLHCLQPVRAVTQPWGGAMAVSRKAFEEHGIQAVWSTNIVDDFSLGPHLAKKGIRTWPVGEACLETPLKSVPFAIWQDWLTRQLLYLKFCTPEMWLGVVPVIWLFFGPALLALFGALGAVFGAADPWWLGAAALYGAAFFGLGLLYRQLAPLRVRLLPWTLGFFATPLMAAWCYLRTWTTFHMRWRGTSYKVGWGGKVLRVIRQ